MTVRELYEWAIKENCLDAELFYRMPLGQKNVPIEHPFACVYRPFGYEEKDGDEGFHTVEFGSAYHNAEIGIWEGYEFKKPLIKVRWTG